jgi:hypothetical protein
LRSEVGEFFSVGIGMQKKIPPKEVWGWEWYFILCPQRSARIRNALSNTH